MPALSISSASRPAIVVTVLTQLTLYNGARVSPHASKSLAKPFQIKDLSRLTTQVCLVLVGILTSAARQRQYGGIEGGFGVACGYQSRSTSGPSSNTLSLLSGVSMCGEERVVHASLSPTIVQTHTAPIISSTCSEYHTVRYCGTFSPYLSNTLMSELTTRSRISLRINMAP
jgi:hypothetical protein